MTSRFFSISVLVLLSAMTTLAMQVWVGQNTIYSKELAPRIEAAHAALISNVPPGGGSWTAVGLNTTAIRVGAPFAAATISKLFNLSITKTYFLIDSTFLFIGLVLLGMYLHRSVSSPYAAIGLLYFIGLLPLTYQFFYYHPWDRISLVSWLVLLSMIRADRIVAAVLFIPIAVAFKFDVVVLPGLVFIFALFRERRVSKAAIVNSALLSVAGLGTYAMLRLLRPGAVEPVSTLDVLQKNWNAFLGSFPAYPPILAFAVPFAVIFLARSSLDAWGKSCFTFGVLLFAYYIPNSLFIEYRAEVPVMLLLLVPMCQGLSQLMPRDQPELISGK